MNCRTFLRVCVWVVLSGCLCLCQAASAQVDVPGTANIYGAGHLVPPDPGGGGGGVLPTFIALAPAANRTVRFTSVSGDVDYGPCCPPNGADGVEGSGIVAAPLWDGLAGTDFSTRARFLVGVFLDDTEPTDPAPERIVFADGAFTELAPGLRQIFFVGDGLTGTGAGDLQTFHVPDGATRLFLGYQDRYSTSPNVPGWYGDNSGSISVTVEQAGDPTGAVDGPGRVAGFRLLQCSPNPFNPVTTIRYELAVARRVDLRVYDMSGRLVKVLAGGIREEAGLHEVDWRGLDESGQRVPSGIYFYRLTAAGDSKTRRMVLVK